MSEGELRTVREWSDRECKEREKGECDWKRVTESATKKEKGECKPKRVEEKIANEIKKNL